MKLLITSEYDERYLEELKVFFTEIKYIPWTIRGKGLTEIELIELLYEENPNAFITELDNVSEKVIEKFPHLEFIGDCRSNPVNIDVETAKKYEIPIFTTPGRNAQAVAELFVGSLISYLRNIPQAYYWTKKGKWIDPAPYSYYKFQGNELSGKKVGFVGFGKIGKKIAEILLSFQCEIIYYDPYVKTNCKEYKSVALEQIFTNSDIVSINLPVNNKTMRMIDDKYISKMSKDSIFINTARSAVVDMDVLYKALKENKIKGAILDVFNSEPPNEEDLKLISLENVFPTPHIGGASYEVIKHQSQLINDAIKNLYLKKNKEEKYEEI